MLWLKKLFNLHISVDDLVAPLSRITTHLEDLAKAHIQKIEDQEKHIADLIAHNKILEEAKARAHAIRDKLNELLGV